MQLTDGGRTFITQQAILSRPRPHHLPSLGFSLPGVHRESLYPAEGTILLNPAFSFCVTITRLSSVWLHNYSGGIILPNRRQSECFLLLSLSFKRQQLHGSVTCSTANLNDCNMKPLHLHYVGIYTDRGASIKKNTSLSHRFVHYSLKKKTDCKHERPLLLTTRLMLSEVCVRSPRRRLPVLYWTRASSDVTSCHPLQQGSIPNVGLITVCERLPQRRQRGGGWNQRSGYSPHGLSIRQTADSCGLEPSVLWLSLNVIECCFNFHKSQL